MAADQHKDLTGADIHKVTAGNSADYAAKEAASYASGLVQKVYSQTDDESVSILTTTAPLFQRFLTGYEARIQTANATETALYTFDASGLTDYVFNVEARITAFVSGGGNAAGYLSFATFKNDSGTVSIVGSTTDLHNAEDTAGWDVQIEASGTDILVNVTGQAATTINWFGVITIIAMKDS